MHVQDDIRPGQVQQVRVTGHIAGVVTQAVATVVGRGQPGALQHRAPGSVEHGYPLVQQLPKRLSPTAYRVWIHLATSR